MANPGRKNPGHRRTVRRKPPGTRRRKELRADSPITFVSYGHADAERVTKRLVKDLRNAGINPWLDREQLVPGEHWDKVIQRALNACRELVVILSPASVDSDTVLSEISHVLSMKKKVIPVLYLDCDIPFRINRLERVDLRNYPRGLHRLLRALGVWQSNSK